MVEGKFKIPNDLNLYTTLTCGQAFRWGLYEEGNFKYAKLDKDGFIWAILYNNFLGLKQEKDNLYYKALSEYFYIPQIKKTLKIDEFLNFYFKFDKDIYQLYKIMEKDKVLKYALSYRGIRILRQEPFEISITFLFSAQNTVHNISKCVYLISKKFSKELYFPNAEFIANLKVEELLDLPVRFKERIYAIINFSKLVINGFDLYSLRHLSYENAHQKLISIKGIGRKIADCILLFSLDFDMAFPIDVHIKNVVFKFYADELKLKENKSLTDKDYRLISEFFRKKYLDWAGWVQQYLYVLSRKPDLKGG
jgi:N-glycosylase/DNA lyase